MKYNRRREIRLSLKAGASFREATSEKEVSLLYNILNNLYTTRVKLPLPSLYFFKKLFLSPIGKVFLVMHNQTIIGGAFCVSYPNNTINTLYYCGIRDYNKKIYPTHLAIMAAIEYGIKNNLKFVDLMGAGKPGDEYGVRKYKEEFGGVLVEHGRYLKIFNPWLYKTGKLGLKTLSKLK